MVSNNGAKWCPLAALLGLVLTLALVSIGGQWVTLAAAGKGLDSLDGKLKLLFPDDSLRADIIKYLNTHPMTYHTRSLVMDLAKEAGEDVGQLSSVNTASNGQANSTETRSAAEKPKGNDKSPLYELVRLLLSNTETKCSTCPACRAPATNRCDKCASEALCASRCTPCALPDGCNLEAWTLGQKCPPKLDCSCPETRQLPKIADCPTEGWQNVTEIVVPVFKNPGASKSTVKPANVKSISTTSKPTSKTSSSSSSSSSTTTKKTTTGTTGAASKTDKNGSSTSKPTSKSNANNKSGKGSSSKPTSKAASSTSKPKGNQGTSSRPKSTTKSPNVSGKSTKSSQATKSTKKATPGGKDDYDDEEEYEDEETGPNGSSKRPKSGESSTSKRPGVKKRIASSTTAKPASTSAPSQSTTTTSAPIKSSDELRLVTKSHGTLSYMVGMPNGFRYRRDTASTTSLPTSGNPTTGQPSTGKPTTGKPGTTGQPSTGKPTTAKSSSDGPSTGKPATENKSSTENPSSKKPLSTGTPATGKSSSRILNTDKPSSSTIKPTSGKPASGDKSTSAKPSTGKPTTSKSTTVNPTAGNKSTSSAMSTGKPTTGKPGNTSLPKSTSGSPNYSNRVGKASGKTTSSSSSKPTTGNTKAAAQLNANVITLKVSGANDTWPMGSSGPLDFVVRQTDMRMKVDAMLSLLANGVGGDEYALARRILSRLGESPGVEFSPKESANLIYTTESSRLNARRIIGRILEAHWRWKCRCVACPVMDLCPCDEAPETKCKSKKPANCPACPQKSDKCPLPDGCPSIEPCKPCKLAQEIKKNYTDYNPGDTVTAEWAKLNISQQSYATDFKGKCGEASLNPFTPRSQQAGYMIGGEDQKYGEWPSFARIQAEFLMRDPESKKLRPVKGKCSGVLISDKHILTAAHCVYNPESREKIPATNFTIMLGDHNVTVKDEFEQVFKTTGVCAAKRFVDPQSSVQGSARHDIAILTLEKPTQFNDHIQPACLPYNEITITNSTKCFVVGIGVYKWQGEGMFRQPRFPNIIQKMRLKQTSCDPWGFKDDDRSRWCWTKASAGGDSCSGDSGGPVYCLLKRRWTVVGLVSYGTQYCDGAEVHGFVGVYSRVRGLLEEMNEDCDATI